MFYKGIKMGFSFISVNLILSNKGLYAVTYKTAIPSFEIRDFMQLYIRVVFLLLKYETVCNYIQGCYSHGFSTSLLCV